MQRAGFLLFPLATAVILFCLSRPVPRETTACMVAFLWQLPALLLLHLLAVEFGWWEFHVAEDQLLGFPVDLWIGWALWWGPVAVLCNRWLPIWVLVAFSVGLDMLTMPLLEPLVSLGPLWMVGDMAAMLICLVPGLVFGKLTREDRSPKRRAMFHTLGWGGYMMLVLPACVLDYEGRSIAELYAMPGGMSEWVSLAALLLLLFVGVIATAEFALVGDGTPIPLDPPKRVVTTGPYAFTANPMQIISAAVMALLAIHVHSWGLALVALMFVIFDAIYAAWYNRAHISHAMPDSWNGYRGAVGEWKLRWQPHVQEESFVVIAPDGLARRVWDRLWPRISRWLSGVIVIDSEERPGFSRLTYHRPGSGLEEYGVRALARILEHGPAPMAMLGWLIRFPYLGGVLQRLAYLMIILRRSWRRVREPGDIRVGR